MLLNFPLLAVPFAICNLIAFFATSVLWSNQVASFRMQSGAVWAPTVGECLIAFSICLLLLELLKATRTSVVSRYGHLFSVIVLVGAVVEFLLVPQATNSVFAILVLLMVVDSLGGWTIAIRIAAARRTVAATPQPVPSSDDAPALSIPTTASESLNDPLKSTMP